MFTRQRALTPGVFLLLSTLLVLSVLAGLHTPHLSAQAPGALDKPSSPSAASAAAAVISWEYDQIRPAVAYSPHADRYLVVWEDHHWGWGADWDIYGRLVRADGVPLGDAFGISWEGDKHRLAPAVAYNTTNGEFLVVWEFEYSAEDHDIYARRVGSDGTLIGGEFVVTSLVSFESSPAVAYNAASNQYLIVWEHLFEERRHGIYGRRVAANGERLGEPIAIDTSSLFASALVPYDALAPAVAYGSALGQYLVVWQDKFPEKVDYDISGRRVGSNGSLVGDEIAICTWEYDQVEPDVAFHSAANEFLVVWEDHHWGWGDDWDIYGQRVNGNGTLAGDNFGISWDGANHRKSPAVAFKAAANEYLVTWEYEYSAADHDVYRRRVARDGTLPDNELAVSNLGSWEARPAVAADARDAYLVVWEDGRDAAAKGLDVWADLARLPQATPTTIPTATPTSTPTTTRTSTATPTTPATHTATPLPTLTATATPTRSATPTLTATRTATPTPSPTSTATAPPTPTVTGTAILTPTATPTLAEGPLPDLLITDIWSEGRAICYQVRNASRAVATRGHEAALFVEGQYRLSQQVGVDLAPDARWKGCFDYVWACTGREDHIMVEADYRGTVPEADETNNRREESWKCDVSPPSIVAGPRVLDITQTSARISWETDEESDSLVQYGQTARLYPLHAADPTLLTAHVIALSGLHPSTTYHFVVQSSDSSGNTTFSRDGTFQTLALPDSVDPVVSLVSPAQWQGTVTVTATVSDNTGVERVEFYLDDMLAFTDYSFPYEFVVDATQFANGPHSVRARAVDLIGRPASAGGVINVANPLDALPPVVNLYHPYDGATVAGDQRILVEITDDTGISKIEFLVNDITLSAFNYPTTPSSVHFSVTDPYWWETEYFPNGAYTVTVRATDAWGRTGQDAVGVTVNNPTGPLRPKLVVTQHKVTRHSNYFGIDLTIANQGGAAATQIRIEDALVGFQPVPGWDASHLVYYGSEFSPATYAGIAIISDTLTLGAGQSRYYTFKAVPVLFESGAPAPSIGDSIGLYYSGLYGAAYTDTVKYSILKTTLNYPDVPVATAHSDALKAANYLLVTNPGRIYGTIILALLFGADIEPLMNDANDLLGAMAHLAYLENGALGYLSSYSAPALSNLITPGGAWAKKLSPSFSTSLGGYLLIVGETEIVPAYDIPQTGTGPIHHSDQPYSDTTGNDDRPDLIVGRIIGNTYKDLAKAIKTSIGIREGQAGYGFDHSHALVIAGGCGGENEWQDDLENKVAVLDDEFAISRIQCLDYLGVSSFAAGYSSGDGFAAGHVTGTTKAEVIIGDIATDRIQVYSGTGTKLKEFDCGFGTKEFAAGDEIAVANSSIIMADSSADRILNYNWAGTLLGDFPVAFDAGDGLATGDVMGDADEEIIIADASLDKILIYTGTGVQLAEFSCSYGPQDKLAVGNVLGYPKAQILHARSSDGSVRVYDSGGALKSSFGTGYTAGDGLAAGDIFGDGKPGIAIADAQSGRIYTYFYWVDAEGKKPSKFVQAVYYAGGFAANDGFASGDLVGNNRQEILVASAASGAVHLSETVCDGKMVADFKSKALNKDVIFFTGHGNPSSWCSVIGTGGLPASFGNSNPLVFAATCSTGNYDGNNDKSIAEAFFAHGASTYIGATIPSLDGWPSERFFKNWVKTTKSVGKAFAQTEQDAIALNQDYYWVREYNLYGDPKIGGSAWSSAMAAPGALGSGQEPPTFVEVVVPDYQVTAQDGQHRVQIPGGALLLVEGQPEVPFYSVALDYPAGYKIQDVVLAQRSGLSTTTGLNIPAVTLTEKDGQDNGSTAAPGWYPPGEYEWRAFQNPDGSTELVIRMYPFYYNPLTTDVQFYKNYRFNIVYSVSRAELSLLQTARDAYPPGQPVVVDLGLNNQGEPQDVIVSAAVRRYGSHEVVAGLLLRTLHSLAGPASFTLQWDSTGFEPDYYYVEAILQDSSGRVLDAQTALFRLGILAGEITSFSATPARFAVGDSIHISLLFHNRGTVDISGTAQIQVQDEHGEIVQEFSHDIAALGPASSIRFEDVWDTSGVLDGTYTILGYVLYDSTASEPAVAVVSTRWPELRVYLPVVLKGH